MHCRWSLVAALFLVLASRDSLPKGRREGYANEKEEGGDDFRLLNLPIDLNIGRNQYKNRVGML